MDEMKAQVVHALDMMDVRRVPQAWTEQAWLKSLVDFDNGLVFCCCFRPLNGLLTVSVLSLFSLSLSPLTHLSREV